MTVDWRNHYDDLMTPMESGGIARRRFLQGLLGTSVLAMSGTQWISGAQEVAALGPDDRILVVVFMGGGNDGMSTVIPAEDGRYQTARQSLALSPGESIPLSNGLYWNPNLAGIAGRYEAGNVAVVQGVGDPMDDLSHFSSTARWMRGSHDAAPVGFTGWLGRWLDGSGLNALGGISLGDRGVPLHMAGNSRLTTALPSHANLYGANISPWEQPLIDAFHQIRNVTPGGPWTNSVATSVADAVHLAGFVEPIYNDGLPSNGIQRDLALAAETINLDIGARVLTASFGDFDTHDDHRPRHQTLMLQFDQAVTEFFTRLNPAYQDRVTLMTFSEFGRSWVANGSAGIDHGTASTALVIGNAVQGGLYGQMPDLTQLDERGDLISTVDFRSYYATVLDGWLNADSQQILGGTYENLRIFDTALGTCEGFPTTIVGTDGPDVLVGTAGRDVIFAGAGDDIIRGMSGDDLICAGEGNDVIWGGEGNDRIVAAAGDDLVHGEAGSDSIDGGDGADRLLGGTEADTINGGAGNDNVWGDAGADTINGDGGIDRLRGGLDNDSLNGGPDRDILLGEDGDDQLLGSSGRDSLYGGNGNDVVDGGDDTDLVRGNAGNDTLRSGNSGNDRLDGGDGNDTLDARNTTGSTRMIGGPGDDQFFGSEQLDRMWGDDGNDRMSAGGFGDLLRGGGDDDIINGDGGSDTIDGGDGNDQLNGGAGGADKLVGGPGGSDVCDGGPGTQDFANATCETTLNIP